MAPSITAPWPAKRRPSWTAPRTLTAGRAGSPRRAASGSSRWRLPALSGGKPSATEIAAWTLASQLTASVRRRRPPSWRGPRGPRAEQPQVPDNTNAGRPVGISQRVNAPRTSALREPQAALPRTNCRAYRRLAQVKRFTTWSLRVSDGPGDSAAGDLAGALLAQRAQVNGGPGAVGPPGLRGFGEGAARAVPLGDLGVQPAF